MSTPTRVVGFLLGLVVAFGAAVGVGNAVGPLRQAEPDIHQTGGHGAGGGEGHGAGSTRAEEVPGGLMVSQAGYTLHLLRGATAPGRAFVAFRITGPDGRPVTAYDEQHTKKLHLVAVRRDLAGFQHVHPSMSDDGTWTTRLDVSPGTWRLFADFKATGAEPLTLGADLAVPGQQRPGRVVPDRRTAVVDGYTVTLDGDLAAGTDSELRLTVSRDGRPVTDLQPYLGAFGHLVALREGDLAYLHVHPHGAPGDGATEPGPGVVFTAAFPSPGRYRLFLDFRHDGVVHTAELAVRAAAGNAHEQGSDR